MPERKLFKSESTLSRAKVAQYLRSVADSLEAGNAITLRSGDQSVTLEPPEQVTFEVQAEREGPKGRGEVSIEFEIEWDEQSSGGGLEIE